MTRHLLHIGYPKAGSTWLQRWFAAHPQMAYREGGIAGFDDVYAIAREGAAGGDEPLYRVTSTEGLSIPTKDSGDMIVDYRERRETDIAGAQLRVCQMLAELFPNAVVLIVTRGYRAMILSSYSQFVRSGGFVGLDELLALTRGPEFARVAPWDYDRLIPAYTAAFGEENVIVMPYELLRDDTATFVRVLSGRLGVEPVAAGMARINESLSPAEMYWYPRLARLVLALRSQRLYRKYVRLSFTNRLRRPIRVLEKLRPRNAVTDAIITDDIIEPFRGRGASLRSNPLYASYKREYLLD